MSVARTILRALPRHAARRAVASSPSSLLLHRAPTLAATNVRHGSSIPPRTESFTTVTKDHVAHLRSLLSSETSLLSTLDGSATADELVTYNDDWMNKYHGKSQVVVRPKTTEEVSKVLKYCYDEGIAVVPQGGNTGLVGKSWHWPGRSCR